MFSSSDIYRCLTSGKLEILPAPLPGAIQPASVDLHLGPKLLIAVHDGLVDPYDDRTYPEWSEVRWSQADPYILRPNSLVLASTVEQIALSNDIVGVVEGKSSLGRLGLLIHQTAGFIDPGFVGNVTLELSVAGEWSVALRPGMPICQISFARTETPATHGYRGKYQGQDGPEPSRYHENNELLLQR